MEILAIKITKPHSYYQEAADLNYSQAMHNLAIAYSLGRGVDVDYDIAFKWFKKSITITTNHTNAALSTLTICLRAMLATPSSGLSHSPKS